MVDPIAQSQPPNRLCETILDYCYSHGMLIRKSHPYKPGPVAVHAPVTVFPSFFPRDAWQEALTIQTTYNLLYYRIANDHEWMAEIMDG
jgi:glutathione synthase